tara:strand:- start:5929 stop:6936 length:1008 start_codon:yes stop_codon:yes gene_type:complete
MDNLAYKEEIPHTREGDLFKKSIPIMTLKELEAKPKTQWLIDGLIPDNALTCIYGPPGSGKSFLALDMALRLSHGESFEELDTTLGTAIYLAGEGISGLSGRVTAWLDYNSKSEGNFLVIDRPVDISRNFELLLESIQEHDLNPDLLIIDTLARCFGANDENSTCDMQKFILGIDTLRVELGCTVLVVHHSSRSERLSLRGNSAFEGVLDTIIKVVAQDPRPNENRRTSAKIVKQKDGAAGKTFWYELEPHLDSAILRGLPPTLVEGESKGSQIGLLVTLRNMIHSNDQWVSAAEWRKAYPILGPDFSTTVAKLVALQHIEYKRTGNSDTYRPCN